MTKQTHYPIAEFEIGSGDPAGRNTVYRILQSHFEHAGLDITLKREGQKTIIVALAPYVDKVVRSLKTFAEKPKTQTGIPLTLKIYESGDQTDTLKDLEGKHVELQSQYSKLESENRTLLGIAFDYQRDNKGLKDQLEEAQLELEIARERLAQLESPLEKEVSIQEPKEELEPLGDYLASRLVSIGCNLNEFTKDHGLNYSTVRNIITEGTKPRGQTLAKLAQALNVDIEELKRRL